ncbi:MAG: cobalamin-dependent protein [Candidatus Hydrogenedentes bacterium]|nr:cobalamin-dependent protein [Candidatus Hydrogenedentota bacterium]
MNVLLVQPHQGDNVKKGIFHPGVEVPLNIIYLAAYLDKENIHNDILDMRISPDPYGWLDKALSESKPDIVGISACTSEFDNAREVARRVKAHNSECLVILGGHHASALAKESLRDVSEIDLVVHGEGELTLTEIVRRHEAGQELIGLAGTAYRDGSEIVIMPRRPLIESLDSLPFPARDKLNIDDYAPNPGTGNYMQLPTSGIMASRGCPYRCNYCSKCVWDTTIRFRSPENVVSEIESCVERFGIKDFRFYDDALTLPKWDIQKFCQMLIDKDLGVTWNCYSRVNHITEEKLRLMKAAGCYHIKYGVEFGTEKALKLANKGATLDMARNAVRLTKKVGIECKSNFVMGIPGENIDDCKQTIAFAKELSPDLASFYPFYLIPGSQFYNRTRDNDPELGEKLPFEVTRKLSNRAYLSFYFRPSYIIQRLARLTRNPRRELSVLINGVSMITCYFVKLFLQKIKVADRPEPVRD